MASENPCRLPRPCLPVRPDYNLTGLSFLLCKMKRVSPVGSALTASMISRDLGWTPREIFHFYVFLSPRLNATKLIGNHQNMEKCRGKENHIYSNCLTPPVKDTANSCSSTDIGSTYQLGAPAISYLIDGPHEKQRKQEYKLTGNVLCQVVTAGLTDEFSS